MNCECFRNEWERACMQDEWQQNVQTFDHNLQDNLMDIIPYKLQITPENNTVMNFTLL